MGPSCNVYTGWLDAHALNLSKEASFSHEYYSSTYGINIVFCEMQYISQRIIIVLIGVYLIIYWKILPPTVSIGIVLVTVDCNSLH